MRARQDELLSSEIQRVWDDNMQCYGVVKVWKQCAREAADKGVYVTWEFEPGFAFNKPSDIIRIADEVNDDNFGVQFDTCHAHMCAAVGARQPGQKETLPGGALELVPGPATTSWRSPSTAAARPARRCGSRSTTSVSTEDLSLHCVW